MGVNVILPVETNDYNAENRSGADDIVENEPNSASSATDAPGAFE